MFKCPVCNGVGIVTCPYCDGTGWVGEIPANNGDKKCTSCNTGHGERSS